MQTLNFNRPMKGISYAFLFFTLILSTIRCSKDIDNIQKLSPINTIAGHPFLNKDFAKGIVTSGLNNSSCTKTIISHPIITKAITYLNTYGANNVGALSIFQTRYGVPLWQYSVLTYNASANDSTSMITPMVNAAGDSITATLIAYIHQGEIASIHLLNMRELQSELANPVFMDPDYINAMITVIRMNDSRIFCRNFEDIHFNEIQVRATETYCVEVYKCTEVTFNSDSIEVREPCPEYNQASLIDFWCVDIDGPGGGSGGGSGGSGGSGSGGGGGSVITPLNIDMVKNRLQSYLDLNKFNLPFNSIMDLLDLNCVRSIHSSGSFHYDRCYNKAIATYVMNILGYNETNKSTIAEWFSDKLGLLTIIVNNYFSTDPLDQAKLLENFTYFVNNNNYRAFVYNYHYNNTGRWWENATWLSNSNNFNLDINNPGGPYDNLTAAEKILVAIYPVQAYIIKSNVGVAFSVSTATGLTQPHNGKQDAFRHAFFNAINTRDVPPRNVPYTSSTQIVRLFSTAHESEVPPNLALEKEMDLWNNEIGITSCQFCYPLITSNESIKDDILFKISHGVLRYLFPLDANENIKPGETQLIPTNQ